MMFGVSFVSYYTEFMTGVDLAFAGLEDSQRNPS